MVINQINKKQYNGSAIGLVNYCKAMINTPFKKGYYGQLDISTNKKAHDSLGIIQGYFWCALNADDNVDYAIKNYQPLINNNSFFSNITLQDLFLLDSNNEIINQCEILYFDNYLNIPGIIYTDSTFNSIAVNLGNGDFLCGNSSSNYFWLCKDINYIRNNYNYICKLSCLSY